MTPPPPREGGYSSAPPTGVRRPTQPDVGGDTTAPWVRDKLAEGERVYGALLADHSGLSARTDGAIMAIREDIKSMKEQMSEDRRDHRERDEEVRDELRAVDDRLDGIANTQTAQGVEIRSHGEQLGEIRAAQKDQGAALGLILTALESAKAVAADRAGQGQGVAPDGGALVPSARAVTPKQAIVGGSVLSTALAVIGATVKLPLVLQWAVAVALIVVVATASWVAARVLIKRLG